jgi:long-chain acyl-CoA synthetase
MSNFYQRFQQAAERWPHNVAIELQRQSGDLDRLTYAELRNGAERVAEFLGTTEPRGARCALLAANSGQWVTAYLGALAAGGIAVPLDTAFSAAQVRKLLLDCGATVLFVDASHRATGEHAVCDLPVRLIALEDLSESVRQSVSSSVNLGEVRNSPGCTIQSEGAASRVSTQGVGAKVKRDAASYLSTPGDVGEDDVAAILYTSGTTSDPKGVMLTHGNLMAEADAAFGTLDVGPTDAILGVLPLFHALAQMANLLLPLVVGARIVYLEALNTRELLRGLRERDITLFCCVPQFFYLIHEKIVHEVDQKGAVARLVFHALLESCRRARRLGLNPGKRIFRRAHQAMGAKMRYLITGGSRFDPAVAADLYALGFEILQAYGLTETSGGATCTPPGKAVLGSVGPPLRGVKVEIAGMHGGDPQRDTEIGQQVGEIVIRGPIVMRGYWGREDATREALREVRGEPGWLFSGDLGYLDARGNLFITGRKKEIIVLSSGKNIYPEEIEAHYQKSPWIKEIAVVGLESAPGEPFAERLHAVIVPDFEVLRAKKIVNAGEMIRWEMDHLSAELPSTKRVLSYELWQEELPRTTTRKLKRFEILRRVKENQAGHATSEDATVPGRQLTEEDIAWLEQPEIAQALNVVREAAKNRKEHAVLHPSDSLELDLGLDSMERVELLVALEQALGTSVPDTVASEVYTVREMVDAVRAGRGDGKPRAEFEGWEKILQQPPSAADVEWLQAGRPIATTSWFMVSRWVQLLAGDLFHLRISGADKLPREGAFILCPNHQSYLDAPMVLSALPWHAFARMFTIGTSEIFGAGLARKMAQSFRLFPVDPDANLIPAMRIGAEGLRHGKMLILYPEGERSIDGSPRRFKKGAAILATHMRVPIVPVALNGFFEAWPRGKGFQKFAPLQIAFLDPVLPPVDLSKPEQAYERMMAEVRGRIVDKWQEMSRR